MNRNESKRKRKGMGKCGAAGRELTKRSVKVILAREVVERAVHMICVFVLWTKS
jgi:hypothetical protein